MATNRKNFRAWFPDVLDSLYTRREAGFAVMMIALPLLERYLRQKAKLEVQAILPGLFYDELVRLFPELHDQKTARNFWQVYRNGLLHEATMSPKDRKGNLMPMGTLTHDKPGLSIKPDGSFWVHPVHFAKRIVAAIETDFATYEGTASAGRLPIVHEYAPGIETSTAIFGTNTGPRS